MAYLNSVLHIIKIIFYRIGSFFPSVTLVNAPIPQLLASPKTDLVCCHTVLQTNQEVLIITA